MTTCSCQWVILRVYLPFNICVFYVVISHVNQFFATLIPPSWLPFSLCFFIIFFFSTFTFSSSYLIIPKTFLTNAQKAFQYPLTSFFKLQTKNTKTSFFYKKTVTHSLKQKPEYTQTDRQNQKTKLKNIKTHAHTNRSVNPSKITEKTLPKALLTSRILRPPL